MAVTGCTFPASRKRHVNPTTTITSIYIYSSFILLDYHKWERGGGGGGGGWGWCIALILSIVFLLYIFLQMWLNPFWTGEPWLTNQSIRWKSFSWALQVDYLFNLHNICVHSCAIFLFMFPWDNMWGHTCLRVTVKYFTFVSPDPHVAPFIFLTRFACFVSHFISVSLLYTCTLSLFCYLCVMFYFLWSNK